MICCRFRKKQAHLRSGSDPVRIPESIPDDRQDWMIFIKPAGGQLANEGFNVYGPGIFDQNGSIVFNEFVQFGPAKGIDDSTTIPTFGAPQPTVLAINDNDAELAAFCSVNEIFKWNPMETQSFQRKVAERLVCAQRKVFVYQIESHLLHLVCRKADPVNFPGRSNSRRARSAAAHDSGHPCRRCRSGWE